jgi:hypothetical protein
MNLRSHSAVKDKLGFVAAAGVLGMLCGATALAQEGGRAAFD